MCDRRFGGVFDHGKIGDIDRKSLHAVALGNTFHRVIEQRPIAIPNRDAAPRGEDTIGHCKTDTLSPASDDRDLPVHITHGVPPMLSAWRI